MCFYLETSSAGLKAQSSSFAVRPLTISHTHVEPHSRSLASSSQLSCRTSRAPLYNYKVERLVLTIDNANHTLANPFVFVQDPNIIDIHPLKSYLSGGREILVRGEYLDSVQQPKMAVFDEQEKLINETVSSRYDTSSDSSEEPQRQHAGYKYR